MMTLTRVREIFIHAYLPFQKRANADGYRQSVYREVYCIAEVREDQKNQVLHLTVLPRAAVFLRRAPVSSASLIGK